jgi:hypothetical protein
VTRIAHFLSRLVEVGQVGREGGPCASCSAGGLFAELSHLDHLPRAHGHVRTPARARAHGNPVVQVGQVGQVGK